MSTPKRPDPAKLIMSLFMNDQTILEAVLPLLEEKFGSIDIISPWFEFDYTDYYYKEMGSPLFRRVVVFKELIEQESLASIKETTNQLETMWKTDEKRSLNIDPGYLVPSRFILATGKDYSHRVYIGKGIYADLTLIYKKGGFQKLEWTYPDYAGDAIKGFLETVRAKYCLDLKRKREEFK
jgi:hypothetical protein